MPKPRPCSFYNSSDRSTTAQQNYLMILFSDLGFTLAQRNAWLTKHTERDCRYLDELTKKEAAEFISELKAMKEDRKTRDEEEDQ